MIGLLQVASHMEDFAIIGTICGHFLARTRYSCLVDMFALSVGFVMHGVQWKTGDKIRGLVSKSGTASDYLC